MIHKKTQNSSSMTLLQIMNVFTFKGVLVSISIFSAGYNLLGSFFERIKIGKEFGKVF